jgi:hypothetical protein
LSCEKTVKDILPYIDGRLQEERRAGVEKHLKTCAPCRLRTDRFRAVSTLLDELPVIEPSTAFDTRVRALLSGEPLKSSWLARLRFSPRAVFAASSLLLATVWLGFFERPSTPALPWSDPKVADEQLIQDLPVLEDHDLLSNFEPLKELPSWIPGENPSDREGVTRQDENGNEQ